MKMIYKNLMIICTVLLFCTVFGLKAEAFEELGNINLGNDGNLEAYYKFEDLTEEKHNYDLTGNYNVFSTGKFGNAFDFGYNVDNRYLYNENVILPGTGNMSISCWVKLTVEASPGTIYGMVELARHDDNSYNSLLYYNEGAATKVYAIRTTAGIAQVNATYQTTLGTQDWYHIGYVYNGSTIKLYVNGDMKNEQNSSGSGSDSIPNRLTFGRWQGAYYYSGLVDDCAVYSRALSDQEMLDIYEGNGIPVTPEATTTPTSFIGNLGGSGMFNTPLFNNGDLFSFMWNVFAKPIKLIAFISLAFIALYWFFGAVITGFISKEDAKYKKN